MLHSSMFLKWQWKLLSHVWLFATPWTMDYYYSPWILQARILEWVAFPFSRVSFQARDWTQISHIAGGFFISWATSKINFILKIKIFLLKKNEEKLDVKRSIQQKCDSFTKKQLLVIFWCISCYPRNFSWNSGLFLCVKHYK